MDEPLKHRNLLSLADLGHGELGFVLELAQRLKQGGGDGAARPLQGCIIGVLGGRPIDPAFAAAADGLGIGLAAIRPGLVASSDPDRLRHTAHWLCRLYDAIDCSDPALAAALARVCTVPVFSGLSTPDHPLHALGTLLTLQQQAGRPLDSLRVAWRGDPRSPAGASWHEAATIAGIRDGVDAGAEWQVEPRGGHVALAGQPDRPEDRIAVLQALLVATLA